MNHEVVALEQTGGDGHPMEHVAAVVPAHTDSIALAETVGMKVGHQHIETQQLMVDACYVEEFDGTVAPAVYHDGYVAAAILTGEVGVMTFA